MSALHERLEDDAKVRELPTGLWEKLRQDPSRAPEHLALAAAERHAPTAEAWVAEKRRLYAVSPAELARMAKKRHASLARFSGAATGVGGIVTIVPDLAAAAWIQSRCVFFIAAAYGYDPRDPMRPAELLVLQELYPDVASAREALDGTGKRVVEAMVTNRMGADEALAARLARMVGNERDTRALADRAIAFYGG